MKLLNIASLAGKDVSGLRVDIRSRNADGTLRYEHTEKDGPTIVTLKLVRFETHKAGPTLQRKYGKVNLRWLCWYWDTTGLGWPHACGYAGVCAECRGHKEYFLEVE